MELCEAGDALIVSEANKHFPKKKQMLKGIAFPTCVSVNNVCGHFSPTQKDDKTVLAEGDLVKIDLGAHIDGYISTAAHTVIATDKPTEVVGGKAADVVCAAYFASEAALHLLRAGGTNAQVTEILQKVATDFGVSVVEGVLSHNLRRYTLDGQKTILSKEAHDQHVELVKFEDFEAWTVDVMMSTGEGKPKLAETKSTVFKRVAGEKYNLKQASSREVLNFVQKNYETLAFNVRHVQGAIGPKALMGLKEMIDHNLLNEYPVLVEKNKELVAHFKFTVLITPTKTEKLNQAPLPYVSSEKKVENADVNAAMAIPLVRKKEKAPKLVASAAAPAAEEKK